MPRAGAIKGRRTGRDRRSRWDLHTPRAGTAM